MSPLSAPPLLVDTDPGADDAIAIAYLAAERLIRLVGVGTVHGNVPPAIGANNALRVLERGGRGDVPVAIGADRPLTGEPPARSGASVHGVDGLGGQAGPPPTRRPVDEDAAHQLVRLAGIHRGELRLLCIAPLTNLALALRIEPGLPDLVHSVTWMGGAVEHPGNVAFRAEANCWHDPEAAEQVLTAGFPLTVVPLDVTQGAWAGPGWFADLLRLGGPVAPALHAWTRNYVENYTLGQAATRRERGAVLHDPLAAVLAVDPRLCVRERHAVVVELLGHARGATWIEQRPVVLPGTELPERPGVDVVVAARADLALERVLTVLADQLISDEAPALLR